MATPHVGRVLTGLLLLMAAATVWPHLDVATRTFALPSIAQAVAGLAAGFAIVTAVMGFAGGELLIPTIVLLYGIDTKLAGSISLAVSLPTMILAFARYSRDTRLSPSSTATNDSG
jgi:hypothetical protein